MGRCKEIFAYLFEEPKDGIGAQAALRRKGSVLDANLEEVQTGSENQQG